jgi:nitrate/nitrite transporter NarK
MLIQGIIYSLGCQLFFLAMTCMLNEWFVKRRGLAYGVMGCGSALFGLALPFFCRWMLDRWGFRNALRAYGVFIVSSTFMLPRLVVPLQR